MQRCRLIHCAPAQHHASRSLKRDTGRMLDTGTLIFFFLYLILFATRYINFLLYMLSIMAESQTTNVLAGPVAPGALEAEDDNWEVDSAVGADDLASSTTSISSSILRYREENGRTYHAYKVCPPT